MANYSRPAISVMLSWVFASSLFPRVESARHTAGHLLPSLPHSKVQSIETAYIRFSLSPENGNYEVVDKPGKVVWRSNPYIPRFGEVTVDIGGKSERANLDRCEFERSGDALVAVFRPLTGNPAAWVRVRVDALKDGRWLEVSYEAADFLKVESVRLLDDALWVTNREKGYIVVPSRMGLLMPADSGLAFSQAFDTYDNEGCDMAMLGIVKNGAAALVTWEDPYVEAQIRSELFGPAGNARRQVLSPSLLLSKSARSFRVWLGGKGDYVTIAKAYRQVAAERGWLVKWGEKLKERPERASLFGAIDFRLGPMLDRQMNEKSTEELSVRVNWTFEEAREIAEHLKNDLKLDKVLFLIDGWIRRGYDNQHPDILPAAAECGGNEGLAQCARQVRSLGFLFCLHDNYQDIYRDSPSWDEGLIMKRRDGSLAAGGRWSGGQAFLICSRRAIELAERPQNLSGVRHLTDANSYFIDTTFAAALQECFDPRHPLTRRDDMKWKQALSDRARSVFGIFGSEDGDEWGIPHSDFFEGLVGVQGQYFYDKGFETRFGAVIIPLFELVYRDSIAMYAKYGYDIAQAADYALYHISIGRPLLYGGIPPHLYWQEKAGVTAAETRGKDSAMPDLFVRAENGWAEGLHPLDRFIKNTYEILSPLNELTAQMELTEHNFLTSDRKVQRAVFSSGGQAAVEVIVNSGSADYRHRSHFGGVVVLPPRGFLVESSTFVAFHARSWSGFIYDDPPLFTLRSLDGKPLNRSNQIRIFHGFGDAHLKLGAARWKIRREAVVSNARGGADLAGL